MLRDRICDLAREHGLDISLEFRRALEALLQEGAGGPASTVGFDPRAGADDEGEPIPTWTGGITLSVAHDDIRDEEPRGAPVARPDDQGARYRNLGQINIGGMGVIYRVYDRVLNRTLAMKVIRPELRMRPEMVDRFIQEAQATAQLDHPGVIAIYSLGRLPDGRSFFTMPEIVGRTFRELIWETHHSGSWTLPRLLGAFVAACEAVDYAHRRGVAHRDIKPENLMVGPFDEVVVIDWGLVQAPRRGATADRRRLVDTDRAHNEAQWTRDGFVAGTPAFMSPEQADGRFVCAGPASDVYSLGAVLYAILAGRPPYSGDDPRAIQRRVIAGDHHPLVPSPTAPAALIAVCERAMSLDPSARHPTAAALGEVVAALGGGERGGVDG